MNKTIKVNLGGFVFQLDEDAYDLLKSYLLKLEQQFAATSEGLEIIEDIEGRIAELLLTSLVDGREVIGLSDIEEIITVMGEPDAYQDEEEGEPSSRQRTRGKLYRENVNTVIGGVASGIATHLNVNSAWIRLGFLISLFAWTLGFWIYIVLWMVLPKRPTSLYRNTEKKESGLVQLLNGFFDLLGRLLKGLFRIMTIILGMSFVLVGLPVIIVILGVSIFPNFHWVMIDGWVMVPREIFNFLDFAMITDASVISLILFLMVTIIPVLLLTYWGVRLLFLIKVKDAWLHMSVGLLWFVSSILLGVMLSSNASLFVENDSSYERVELSIASDTLWLMMNIPIDQDFYDCSISVPDYELTFYYNKEKKKSCGLVELDIHTSSDSLAFFRIEKGATGASRSKARLNLHKVTYDYVNNDNYLALDEGYCSSSFDKPWIPSRVEIDLFIPSNTVLVVDKRIKRLLNAENSLWRRSNEVLYVN